MEDEKYIRRCIELAKNGICTAPPNPMVGAVIVHKGRIIGEGYHVHCGESHAEVNAITSVGNPALLKESTIYVSLEPCSHYGKTPPCADLIVRKQIPRVVIGCLDPFPEVSGRGVRRLQEAGYEVKVGVLESECRRLTERFITFHTQRRPYILLKWAESADGFIDVRRDGGSPVHLSSSLSNMVVHKLRSESSAILVGRRTAQLDNPSLTVRDWCGKNPLRIVIDRSLSLPNILKLFDGEVPTLVFTAFPKENRQNVEYVVTDFSQDILPQLIGELYRRNLQTLMVEGGSLLLQSFIDASLWDEMTIEECPQLLHGGVAAPHIEHLHLNSERETRFGRSFRHYRRS